jgi:hypothetical protein
MLTSERGMVTCYLSKNKKDLNRQDNLVKVILSLLLRVLITVVSGGTITEAKCSQGQVFASST